MLGYCTEDEYEEFLRFCPLFEDALMNDGMMLVKYWLSVSDDEQERRFQKRLADPRKRWKFSPTDVQARSHWVDYAEAKDHMFAYTDTDRSPWFVVEGDSKKAARLNLISHLLSIVPYKRLDREHEITLPPRQKRPFHRLQDGRKTAVGFQPLQIFHAIAARKIEEQHRQYHLQVQPPLPARKTNVAADRRRQTTLPDQVKIQRQPRQPGLAMIRTLRLILEIQHTL